MANADRILRRKRKVSENEWQTALKRRRAGRVRSPGKLQSPGKVPKEEKRRPKGLLIVRI